MQKRRNESKDGAAKQQRDQLWRNFATLAKINLFTEKYATVQILSLQVIGRILKKSNPCSHQRDGIYRANIVSRNLLVPSQPSPFHDQLYFDFLKAHNILTLCRMPMDLEFILKWIKSVIGCALYIFHLSGWKSH